MNSHSYVTRGIFDKKFQFKRKTISFMITLTNMNQQCQGNIPPQQQQLPMAAAAPQGAAVVAPQGAAVVAPQGAAVVAPQGAAVVAPQGAAVVAPQGAAVVAPVIPAINVIVPTQLLGNDRLPRQTQVVISEGTTFIMNAVMGRLVSQNGQAAAANIGHRRRIIWPTGTIFYINDNPRNQCVINEGHQEDTLPLVCSIILPPGTEISWGGRLVRISRYESVENRTVILN
jgi:hypothetical protein